MNFQVVLNFLLEQAEPISHEEEETLNDPKFRPPRDPSPEPMKKNKAGNGMKSKNSSKNKAKETLLPVDKVSKKEDNEVKASEAVKVPKKRALLDLNLEIHPELAFDNPVGPAAAKVSKMARPPSGTTVENNKQRENQNKIALSEDQLHGPFDFRAHRRNKASNSKATAAPAVSNKEKTFAGIRDDLNEVIKKAGNSKSPELVDIADVRSPPVVDLSETDQKGENGTSGHPGQHVS